MVGNEREGSTGEHFASEVFHDRLGLEVEVSEHFVGPPTPEKANDVGIDLGTEKGIRAGGAEASCGDILREEPEGWSEELDGSAEG